MSFIVQEGPCELTFGVRWKAGEVPGTDEERRLALLQTLDALYSEVERPWREEGSCGGDGRLG